MSKTGLAPIQQEKESLVDRACNAVRHSIVAGSMRPGEVVSISDLATDLGVSHSPVREAIQRLADQGLILLRPARSAVVAPLDVEDLTEIYRLRGLIEVDAAGRACPQLEPADDQLLERELDALGAVATNSEEFWRHHDAFHRALMRPVMTPRLERITSQLWQAAERYIRVVYVEVEIFSKNTPLDRHRPLVEAAASRDGKRMQAALGEHLDSNERELTAHIREILAR